MEVISYEHQNEEGKFVPCRSCGMYQFFNYEQFLSLKGHCKWGNSKIDLVCFTCSEKTSLLLQIEDLNNTVSKLEDRITSLQRIRELEGEIDRTHDQLPYMAQAYDKTNSSIDELINEFANFTVGSSDIPQPTYNITIDGNEVTHMNNDSCITSVWDTDSNHSADNVNTSIFS